MAGIEIQTLLTVALLLQTGAAGELERAPSVPVLPPPVLVPRGKSTQAAGDAPSIDFTDAPFEIPAELRDSIRFGYLTVPQDHTRPDGSRLRIAVAVLPSRATAPAPDPVVFIPGGPGGSATDMAVTFARSPRIALYRERRAFILLDPRGHGRSDPALCPETLNGAEPLAQDSDAAEAKFLGKLAACRARVTSAGVRLETLNSVQAANDIELLRRALNAPSVNLIGGSYGARIAAEAIRVAPSAVRAVNFLGPVPPGLPHLSDDAEAARDILSTVVRRCEEQSTCSTAYPQLSRELDTLLVRTARSPVRIAVPRSDRAPEGEIHVDEDLLVIGLGQLANGSDLTAVPLLIHRLASEGFDLLQTMAPQLIRQLVDDSRAQGASLAFHCNDSPMRLETARRLPVRCRTWIGAAFGDSLMAPVRSDVRALILVGEFDASTPPSYARALAQGLSRAHVVVMPWTGHDRPPDCAIRITRDFFESPDRAPDTACMDSVPPIEFVGDVVRSRWLGRVVVETAERPWTLGGPAAAALLMLAAVAGMPLAIHRARARGGQARATPRLAAAVWLAAFAGVVLIAGVLGAVLAGARRHLLVPVTGVLEEWSWVLVMPWAVLGLAAATAALAWRDRSRAATPMPAPGWSGVIGVALTLALWAYHARG